MYFTTRPMISNYVGGIIAKWVTFKNMDFFYDYFAECLEFNCFC